jgi:hypothetical protein
MQANSNGVVCSRCADLEAELISLRALNEGLASRVLAQSELLSKRAEKGSVLEAQVGGDHYKSMKIQPVEFIHANKLDFFQGVVIRYVCRHKNKNGRQDLEKAIHFLQLALELQYPIQKEHSNER